MKKNRYGQLTVDVFQTPTHINIKASLFVVGVKRVVILDIGISRDMVTIHGKERRKEIFLKTTYFHVVSLGYIFSNHHKSHYEVDISGWRRSYREPRSFDYKLPKIDKERQNQIACGQVSNTSTNFWI